MYNLDQLKAKGLEELQQIASEMGIKSNGLDEGELRFRIIDEQAISAASSATEQPERRKRQRVAVKNVDRVYTANKTKAKKIDKAMTITKDESLFADLSNDEKAMLNEMDAKVVDAASETAAKEESPAPKKRTRKTKTEKESETSVKKAKEKKTAAGKETPKKRERKTKNAAESETADDAKNVIAEETKSEDKPVNEDTDKKTPRLGDDAFETDTQSGIPEADFTPQSNHKSIIINKTSDFTPPTDGTDFIIVQDISAEESYSPMQIFKETEQGVRSQENRDSKGKAKKQTSSERPVANETPYKFDNIVKISGVLDTVDNYGFLRSSDYNYLPSPDDVYVSPQQIKQYGLKTGDVVEGYVRPPKDGERFFPLTSLVRINGCDPAVVRDRIAFEFLTPLFPDEKFKLCSGNNDSKSSRIVDLFAPIGKGQRALIVAQPKTGKTLLMKDIANSIARNHPDAYLIMLLIDERPEEVTDMARTVNAEVIASTFDAPAENHVKIAGIVLEKAKRMVECGHDVVIFLDSITRLARAYNTVSPASGKVLSGGVDANALHKPKRFFGAARNIENGGSLTIIATALIDTGSKMDEVIFEEFKGRGNMELQLDRSLSNKRIFPAVNLVASSTRRDDLLQDQTTLNRMWVLRKHIADMTPIESMNLVMNYVERTKNNEEFLISMNG